MTFRGFLRSLAFRTGLMYVVMTLLLISLFVVMIFENQLDLILQNAVLKTQDQSRRILSTLEAVLGQGENATLDLERARQVLRDLGLTSYRLFSEGGEVLLASGDAPTAPWATAEEFRELNEVLTRRAFEGKAVVQKLWERNLRVFVSVALDATTLGVLRYELPMEDIGLWMERLYRQVLVVVLLIALINGGFAVYFLVKIFYPLSILVRATRTIEAGDLEVRVPIVQNDEIGDLAQAFNEMGAAIRRMHDEARGANPLSGLPGNRRIVRELERRLLSPEPFAVLYLDLDHFKAFNDKYGFSKGDEVILFVRDCLQAVQRETGNPEVFLGHEGGDDYVVILPYDLWQDFAERFIRRFDTGIRQFYSPSDARQGYIESVTRQGTPARFPIMSVSIAVVSNRYRRFEHHAQMVQAAAEVKKLAKSREGSSFVEDLRGSDA